MKYYNHLLILLFSLMGLSTFAQTSKKTLNYQAVILDPKAIDIPGASITGQPLNKGNVCLRFSLLNAQGGLDYEETQQVTTDEYGLVNVAIGAGAQAQAGNSTSIYKSFESVVWNSSVKSLKVSVSYDGCSSFKQVSAQALNYTPYALYAEAVDYKNVREAPTKLSQFSNDAGFLIPKDLDPLKADIKSNTSQLATANQTIADNKKSSDATFLIVNQSIKSLDTKVAENASSISNINTKITDQQNQILDNRNQITATNNNINTQIGGLQGQLNTTNSTVNNLTGAAEVVSNKSTAVDLGGTNPSDQAYPSQKAAKAYVDQVVSQIATTGVPDATTLAAGKLQLSGDLSGTATSPTVPALANKENSNNKSTNVQTDAASDTKYPSVKAVKTYVDQAVNGTALQATVDGKADKASPALTGIPTAPTALANTSTTQIATTAFVQAATAGIALQAAVDAKADKNSPTFTGTPILPTGTTGATQLSGDNSTKLATTAYVDAQVANGAADATTSSKGIVQLTGDFGGTALAPTVPGLVLKANSSDVATSLGLKEDLSNKSNAALGTSTTLYPTENAVKTYVDASVTSGAPDATTSLKGKIQLAGDLGGSALSPSILKLRGTSISSVAPVTAGHVLTYDATGSGVAYWAAPANSANTISGVVPVANGGTGLMTLTSGGAVYATSVNGLATGTLPLTAGGTGAITKQTAFDALSPMTSAGDIMYGGLNGTGTRLGKGNNFSFLTLDAGGLPTWTNAIRATAGSSYNAAVGFSFIGDDWAKNTGMFSDNPDAGDAILKFRITGNSKFTIDPNKVAVLPTTASSSKTTGALTVAGGLGVDGNIYSTNLNASGTVTAPIYASAPQALTDGATITWNPANGLNASVTLGGNRTLSFSTPPASGSSGTLVLTQDVTGGRTITLPSTTNKVLGSTSTTSIALSEASGATDILNFYYDGTNCFWKIGQGYGINGTTNLSSSVSGKLPVANGGTGANTLTGIVKGNGTSALTAAIAGTDYQEPITLTTTGTGSATLSGTTLNIPLVSSTVNTSTLSGTVALANGGTGASTQQASINALTGTQSTGKYLRSDGTNATLTTIQAADVPTLNQNTTGNAATATTAGNITATSNSTLTSLSSLNTVGTITSGTISITTNIKTSSTLTAGTVTYPNTHAGASGQVLTSLGSGTLTWTTPASASSSTHTIGEVYGGGIVFYIWDGGAHGLIAPFYTTSQMSTNPLPPILTSQIALNGNLRGITADGLLAGKMNTTLIISNQGSGTYAAAYCYKYQNPTSKLFNSVTYTFPIYSDWYLPSIYEIGLFRSYLWNYHPARGSYVNQGNFVIYYLGTIGNGNDYAWGKYISSTMDANGYYYNNYVEGNSINSQIYSGGSETDRLVCMPIRSF